MYQLICIVLSVLLSLIATSAQADTSKIIATGGATTIEGGGGIAPWAVINGYASSDEF
jgi:hypothetical protein